MGTKVLFIFIVYSFSISQLVYHLENGLNSSSHLMQNQEEKGNRLRTEWLPQDTDTVNKHNFAISLMAYEKERNHSTALQQYCQVSENTGEATVRHSMFQLH